MIQKNSILIPSDKSGVQVVKVFHLYTGFSRKIAYFGNFVKVSVRDVKIGSALLKKAKPKGLLIRTKKNVIKSDGSFFLFDLNNVILLKKRTTSYGKRMFGPILKNIKRKKLISSFSKIL
jgi:large subunit ribosomal protein L14